MDELTDLFRHLIDVLERLEIPYAVGGSTAAFFYGEPRFTLDIDVVVRIRPSDVPRLVAEFPPSEYYVSLEAAQEAVRTGGQFNIIHPSGSKVDVYVASDEIDQAQLERARRIPGPDGEANYSPPEELIVKKMQYYAMGESPKHTRDIASMLRISRATIDRDRISELADKHDLTHVWESILMRLED